MRKKQKKITEKSTCFPEIIKTPSEPLAVNATPDLETEKKVSCKKDSNNIHLIEWEKIQNIDEQQFVNTCHGERCTFLDRHFHCKLCNNDILFSKLYKLKRHLKQVHLNLEHCAKYSLIGCLPCRVSDHCKTISKKKVNHYHCPVCQKTIRQKQNFTIHLENHKKQQFNEKRKFKKERRFSDTENKEQETENDVAEAYQEKFDYETKTILSNKEERVQCSSCEGYLRKDNLKRHMDHKHSSTKEEKTYVCVDSNYAIYMVPKNERGIKYPLHVQKHIHGTKEPKNFCENEVCIQFMSVCHNSGLQNELCRHLKSASAKNSFFPEKTILHDDVKQTYLEARNS